MILSDGAIKTAVKKGDIIIKPFNDEQIQPASFDMRLGDHFLVIEDKTVSALTLTSEPHYREIKSKEIIIPPGSFVLATTQEHIELPKNITAFVEGRSSIGRLGLFIHNAGWIDPGFKGKITLELYNANSIPIKLEAGRRICQFVFCRTEGNVHKPYSGKYSGQNKTTGSRIYMDDEIKNNH